jgi:hypothetical protein
MLRLMTERTGHARAAPAGSVVKKVTLVQLRQQRNLAGRSKCGALHYRLLPVSFAWRLSVPNLTEASTKTTTDRTISTSITSAPFSESGLGASIVTANRYPGKVRSHDEIEDQFGVGAARPAPP